MKKKVIICGICVTLLAVGLVSTAFAEDTNLNSKGRIGFNEEDADPANDVVFDASDLIALDTKITEGKIAVAQSLNQYGTSNLPTIPTFDDIVNGINTLTDVPADTYFYDNTTGTDDASTLKRYKKENGVYFECDEHGNKTSDEVSVDTSNLTEYTETTDGNLSAGAAGFADKSLVLGSGADNINYRNLGYAEGLADGIENASVEVVYHHHTDECNPHTVTCRHDYVESGVRNVWVADEKKVGHRFNLTQFRATGTVCGASKVCEETYKIHYDWVETVRGCPEGNWSHQVTVYDCGFNEGDIEAVMIKYN